MVMDIKIENNEDVAYAYADRIMKAFGLLSWEKNYERVDMPFIDRVIFNGPATIVFWKDGTKTVVKCRQDEAFDYEKGLAMAMCKRLYGNKGNFNNVFKKWAREDNGKE